MRNDIKASTAAAHAGPRSEVVRLVGVVGFAVALAAASQIALPLPGTPVPFTLQPLIVVLAGLWLGPMAAASSMLLFLAAGAVGLPVFTPGGLPGVARFLGPTGGYLLAYPVAAFLTGVIARRAGSFPGRWIAAIAGMAVIHLGGMTQLAVITGDMGRAFTLGVLPFALLDVAKAALAALLTGRRSPHA